MICNHNLNTVYINENSLILSTRLQLSKVYGYVTSVAKCTEKLVKVQNINH